MQWIYSVFTAALVTGACYGMLYRSDSVYQLELRKKGNWITDKAVFGIVGLTFIGTLAVGKLRLLLLGMPSALLLAVLLWGMAVLAVIDGKRKLIPNRFLLGLLMVWATVTGCLLIIHTESGLRLLFSSLAGALIGGAVFLLCYILSRGQMGAGDVKLACIMGLYLTGDRILGAVFYGTLLCGIYSLVQLFRKKLTLKNGVPMTPFLYMGTLLILLMQ